MASMIIPAKYGVLHIMYIIITVSVNLIVLNFWVLLNGFKQWRRMGVATVVVFWNEPLRPTVNLIFNSAFDFVIKISQNYKIIIINKLTVYSELDLFLTLAQKLKSCELLCLLNLFFFNEMRLILWELFDLSSISFCFKPV